MRVARSLGTVAALLLAACSRSTPAPAPAPAPGPQTAAAPSGPPNVQPAAGTAGAGQAGIATSIGARTGGMERRDGLIPLYLDDRQGKLYLEIPRDSLRVL